MSVRFSGCSARFSSTSSPRCRRCWAPPGRAHHVRLLARLAPERVVGVAQHRVDDVVLHAHELHEQVAVVTEGRLHVEDAVGDIEAAAGDGGLEEVERALEGRGSGGGGGRRRRGAARRDGRCASGGRRGRRSSGDGGGDVGGGQRRRRRRAEQVEVDGVGARRVRKTWWIGRLATPGWPVGRT